MNSRFAAKLESYIIQDKYFISSFLSYAALAAILVNMIIIKSPILGLLATLSYFLINGVFLGTAFFAKENGFLKLMLGILLLTMLLGLVGWITIILYALNTVTLILSLVVVATVSSVLRRTVGSKGDRHPA